MLTATSMLKMQAHNRYAQHDSNAEAWNSSTDDKDRITAVPHPLIPALYELRIDGDLITYYCEICFKPSSNRAYMRNHLKQHFGRRIYQCDVCGQTFPIHRSALLHRRSHDQGLCSENSADNDMGSLRLLRYSGVSLLRKNPSTPKKSDLKAAAVAGEEQCDDPAESDTGGKPEGTMSRALVDLLKALRLTDVVSSSASDLKCDESNGDKSQNGQSPYKCSACSVEFESADALIDHVIAEGELSKLYGPSSSKSKQRSSSDKM